MSTVRDILKASLRKIEAIATGETPDAAELSESLSAMNMLLDSWSNENLFIYSKVREEFNFVASQYQYTMGSGGDFSTTRPLTIEQVLVKEPGADPVFETPVEIITKDEYSQITVKVTETDIPTKVYPDYGNPLVTLNFWGVPGDSSYKAVIYSAKALTTFTTSQYSTSLTFPPGYERALVYNLALELAPEFGKVPSADVYRSASESKAAIKRKNIIPKYMGTDPGVRQGQSVFNWLEGTSK